ncbi:MAG: cytochrome c oxidase accessory protein CcoG ['Candidatus Kapabacteria' thiocyanatum]|uniref:Cytochrome c oxidase accessory protein CcoG n=1 Tax=Candidatus Kapaibacterium thiocyanatum TaxID=1895771 RepID=A0A1M3KYJ2_9BACT|nr:cytochrome c oxidase accessory protein CcoG ['Candidatus Kapabacteria' thiocyanatum]OJX57299.1 MAG: cytochrome c oxidase accessory protein CcoG ['Candidatus Kapabacteria' thiocyanatum]
MSITDAPVEDHERFRNELGSIYRDGRRKWIFARKPSGPFYRWRTVLGWLLLAFLVLSPFIEVNGHQFMLFDLFERRFVILGMVFWPQDIWLLVLLFLTGIVSLVLFTATLGRIWCGWLCPQTIFMEMVFRKIEWMIDGPPAEQVRRTNGPWTKERILRTVAKQSIFFAISFGIANVFLAYLIGSDTLLSYVREGIAPHLVVFLPLLAFTGVFYLVFARFREQACIIVCPYGRYMSALVDESTIAITYDFRRGEKRGKFTRGDKEAAAAGEPRPSGLGDCIDCHQCVTVCPTGIDIRNGIQLECVNCTACIDACDDVMTKIGRPKGLIRYASVKSIIDGASNWMTPRIKAYAAVWIVLVSVVAVLFFTRRDVDILVLRQEGTTWVATSQGVGNFYRMEVINKTSERRTISMRVIEPANVIIKPLTDMTTIGPYEERKGRFMLIVPDSLTSRGSIPIRVSIRANDDEVWNEQTSFLVSRNGSR